MVPPQHELVACRSRLCPQRPGIGVGPAGKQPHRRAGRSHGASPPICLWLVLRSWFWESPRCDSEKRGPLEMPVSAVGTPASCAGSKPEREVHPSEADTHTPRAPGEGWGFSGIPAALWGV